MKKMLCLALLLGALFVISPCSPANAQYTPPVATTITVDAPAAVTEIWNSIVAGYKKASAYVEKVKTEINSKLQAVKDYADKIKKAFQSWVKSIVFKEKGQPNIPVARKIEPSKEFDIKDEEAIVTGFENLFLRYPKDILESHEDNAEAWKKAVKRSYKLKAQNFADDSFLEMYLTVRALEERMDALKKEFSKLSACYVEGNQKECDGTLGSMVSDNDKDIEIWVNYYSINLIYDQMLQVTEELFAIQAQYEVAQAIRVGIEPLMPEDLEELENPKKNDKTSDAGDILSVGAQISSAFAQQTKKSDDPYALIDAEPVALHAPMEGTEEQFRDLAKAANLYEQLKVARDLHNLKQQMPDFKHNFEQVDRMRKLHKKAIEQLRASEACVLNHLNRYYGGSEGIWLGSECRYDGTDGTKISCSGNRQVTAENLQELLNGQTMCSTDGNLLCDNFGINDYAQRGGFSGWLVSAYKAAKAEKAIAAEGDDLSSPQTNMKYSRSLSDIADNADSLSDEHEAGTMDSGFKKSGEGEEILASTREADLVSWQIGAEGAEALGADMISSNPKWGSVTKPYPLWTDEKIFYKQYLDAKYENMKLFVQNLDLGDVCISAAGTMTNALLGDTYGGIKIAQIKTYNQNVLDAARTNYSQKADDREQNYILVKTKKENDTKMENLKKGFDNAMAQLESQREALYRQLDIYGPQLDELKEAYNVADEMARSAEGQVLAQDNVLAVHESRKDKSEYVMDGVEDESAATVEFYEGVGKDAQEQKEELEAKINEVRAIIDGINAGIESINAQIAALTAQYAEQASAMEAENIATMKKAIEKALRDIKEPSFVTSDYFTQALSAYSGNGIQKALLQGMAGLADSYAQKERAEVLKLIEKAHKDILAMEDDIYDIKKYDEIVEIHNNLIKNIKDVISIKVDTSLPIKDVSRVLSNLFSQGMVKAICKEGYCEVNDPDYFVGLMPKSRDFSTPKAIITTYTPPLREIVHFDIIDYNNVSKSESGEKTTRAEFMDYGQKVPEIWKRILSSSGFVERDVDIEAFLAENEGAEDILLRGGTYPCIVGGYTIDFNNGNFYISQGGGGKLNCRGIKAISVRATGSATLTFNNDERVSGIYGPALKPRHPSELSLLLRYNKGVTFSKKIKNIIEYFANLEQNSNAERDVKFDIMNNALLNRNQFGDFLDFVETELAYQKSLEELEVGLKDVRKTITTQMNRVGEEIAEDFDLADEDTYNEITEKMDKHKNKLVDIVSEGRSELKAHNDSLLETLTKIDNLTRLLQLDNNELVRISDNTVADSSFSESITQAQTDKLVMDKYKKEAEEDFQKQLNNFKEPYCSVYEEN